MVVTCKVFIAKDLLIHICYTWLRTFYSRCSAVKVYLFRDSFSPLNIVVSINHAISVITIIEMSSARWLQIFQVYNFIGNTFFFLQTIIVLTLSSLYKAFISWVAFYKRTYHLPPYYWKLITCNHILINIWI